MSKQLGIFGDLGEMLNPKAAENIISSAQLSAESKAEFERSGQGATLRAAVLKYLNKQEEGRACFEIEAAIGREVQHTGVLVELKKEGRILASQNRTKVNPKSGRRVSVYWMLNRAEYRNNLNK